MMLGWENYWKYAVDGAIFAALGCALVAWYESTRP